MEDKKLLSPTILHIKPNIAIFYTLFLRKEKKAPLYGRAFKLGKGR